MRYVSVSKRTASKDAYCARMYANAFDSIETIIRICMVNII